MSILFGPLSETMSSVSCRDWALAGDHTAGADTIPPAATAVIDFKNSRRFMRASQGLRVCVQGDFRKDCAKVCRNSDAAENDLYLFVIAGRSGENRVRICENVARGCAAKLHTI